MEVIIHGSRPRLSKAPRAFCACWFELADLHVFLQGDESEIHASRHRFGIKFAGGGLGTALANASSSLGFASLSLRHGLGYRCGWPANTTLADGTLDCRRRYATPSRASFVASGRALRALSLGTWEQIRAELLALHDERANSSTLSNLQMRPFASYEDWPSVQLEMRWAIMMGCKWAEGCPRGAWRLVGRDKEHKFTRQGRGGMECYHLSLST